MYKKITRYQHIERLGHDDVDGILNGEVIVQEKLDGANLTIGWDPDTGLVICSRNRAIYADGVMTDPFNGAVDHVLANPCYASIAKAGHVIRGEWLVRHTIMYNEDAFGKLYVFDVQTSDLGTYLHPDKWSGWFPHVVDTVARGNDVAPETLVGLVTGTSKIGAEREGIVIKNYLFVNKWGRATWAKLVSADFKERAASKFGANRFDSKEARFVADCVPASLVHKTIAKVKDDKGEVSVRDMAQILGRVWFDAFTEELWTFVKKERIHAFDFHYTKKLCDAKTRDICLAVFNGIPSAERFEKREA